MFNSAAVPVTECYSELSKGVIACSPLKGNWQPESVTGHACLCHNLA